MRPIKLEVIEMYVKAKFNLDKMGFVFEPEAMKNLEVIGVPVIDDFKTRKPLGYITESKFDGTNWNVTAIVENNSILSETEILNFYPGVHIQDIEIRDRKSFVKKFKLVELSAKNRLKGRIEKDERPIKV